MDLGKRLADMRKYYGYTQKELADRMNLSQQVISNIERNTTSPDIDFLSGLADLYNITIDDLIGRKIISTEGSYEKRILDVIESMDEPQKELSLRIVNEVAQQKGDIND